jgi:hypothetical protein
MDTGNDVGGSVQLEHATEKPESTEIRLTDPIFTTKAATSEEHSCTDGEALKSTLLPKDVLQWYLNAEEKLRGDLKLQGMDDHVWCLQSWDQDGEVVVKLFCREYWSFIGGSIGKQNENRMSNLFSTFPKNHLINTWPIRNYYHQRGIKFDDHPQSGSTHYKSLYDLFDKNVTKFC